VRDGFGKAVPEKKERYRHMLKKVLRKQSDSEACFVCGKKNERSLKAQFYTLEDESVAGFVTVGPEYVSYPGVTHGGIVAALLDEVAGRAQMAADKGRIAMTVEMNVKYKCPVTPDTKLLLYGRVIANGPKICLAEGRIYLPDGSLAASSEGKYYKLPGQQAAGMGLTEHNLKLYPGEGDPTEVEIPDR